MSFKSKSAICCSLLAVVAIVYFHQLIYFTNVFKFDASGEFYSRKGLTFQCTGGELGNKMFFYAVVYGLSRLNNRIGYVQKCNTVPCRFSNTNCCQSALEEVFNLSLPVRPDLPENEIRGHAIRLHIRFPDDYRISAEANVLVGELYPVSVTHFLHVRDKIRKEFTFRKLHLDYADAFLTKARGTRVNVTFVGVHVRRTSYLEHLKSFGKKVAPRAFFLYAMGFFKRTIPRCMFVVISDDLDWSRDNLSGEDVYVPEEKSSAADDLAVLSRCQHSIFDYGTYGFWGAFLAGGKTMYYIDGIIDPTEKDTVLAQKMYPSEWIGVSSDMLASFEY